MEASGDKNYHFFVFYHIFEQIEERSGLFLRSHHEEIDFHGFRQGDLLMNVAVVSQASQGEFCEVGGDGGAEHESLRRGAFG